MSIAEFMVVRQDGDTCIWPVLAGSTRLFTQPRNFTPQPNSDFQEQIREGQAREFIAKGIDSPRGPIREVETFEPIKGTSFAAPLASERFAELLSGGLNRAEAFEELRKETSDRVK